MFFFVIISTFLLIQNGQAGREATAVLYGDNSMNTAGTLKFTQSDSNSAVRITGTLSGLNISAAHVSQWGVMKRMFPMHAPFILLRVFTSISMQSPKEIPVVQQLVVISILTVRVFFIDVRHSNRIVV